MGHFSYLINSDTAPNNLASPAARTKPNVCIEGPRSIYPLPWICCFRKSDLVAHTIAKEKKSEPALTLQVPMTTVENALRNLKASLPRYERLLNNPQIAREYWQQGINAIGALRLRYVTLDVTDFVRFDPTSADVLVSGLSTDDPTSGSDGLFEYFVDIPPRTIAEFRKPPPRSSERKAQYEASNHNSCILFCPEYTDIDWESVDSKHFRHFKENAEKGVSGAMFNVGMYYLKGQGTPKNIQEGVLWCTKAAEAGEKQSARFLWVLYDEGAYDVPIDKTKAAHWKVIYESWK